MRVLITGATGFVGSAIASHLCSHNYDVLGLSSHYRDFGRSGSSENVVADITSFSKIKTLAKETHSCDSIIHAAASLNMDLYSNDVTRVNCVGMQNMLWLAQQWNCRSFIFLSSVSVIGAPLVLPVSETHPTYPSTAYHASKLFGEHLATLASDMGLTTTSLRLTAPVGPGTPKDRFLSVLVRHALKGEKITLAGRGFRQQNYIDVRDIARATKLFLETQVSGVFNIAARNRISNIDLAVRCVERCQSRSKITLGSREDPHDDYIWDISIEKARIGLGYDPIYSLDASIDAVITETQQEMSCQG